MSTPVAPLIWTPSQGGSPGSLVAQVILDSALGNDYVIPTVGKWNTELVVADGVIVSNIGNNGTITIEFGALTVAIPPFIRDTLALGQGNAQNIGLQFSVGLITLYFYKGRPPITPQVYNYAGAAAVSNTTCFTGGDTLGTANAQTISVQTNYQFSNGVLVIGTAGFTNTGALTLNINGMGAVPVMVGGKPCVGGEFQLGTNFMVSVDADSGTLDLLSNYSTRFQRQMAMPAVNTTATVAHGLMATPFNCDAFLVCMIADLGYNPGATIKFIQAAQQNTGIALLMDALNLYVYVASAGIFIPASTAGGNTAAITPASWNFLVKAWL